MGTVTRQCYKESAIAKRRKVVALTGGSCLGRKPAAVTCVSVSFIGGTRVNFVTHEPLDALPSPGELLSGGGSAFGLPPLIYVHDQNPDQD